jgi:chloramphenicol O-acetyltransferase type B
VRYFRRARRAISRWRYTRSVRGAAAACGSGLRVNGRSSVTSTTVLGSNIHFNGMTISGRGMVEIGDNFHSGPECVIISEAHNYEGDALPYDATYVARDVRIEDNVWLGIRVIVLGGVTIGEGAIVQAGSVVAADIPKYAIAGGHPARPFAQRDIEHYERLKAAGRFH